MKIEFKNHNDFPLVWPETMRGVLEMLDKYFPSITDGIDLDNFNMTKANICIFGHTIGWRNRGLMFDFRTRCNNNYYPIANQTEEWTQAIIDYRESKMKNKFNLKTQPWFIRTETPEQRIAAQEWLFEQGMAWDSGSREAFDWNFQCLTNTSSSGDKTLSFGHIPKPHKSAQEIELTYKTTVNNVVYPDIESERDKEIKAIRKEQEALAARLKALEVRT